MLTQFRGVYDDVAGGVKDKVGKKNRGNGRFAGESGKVDGEDEDEEIPCILCCVPRCCFRHVFDKPVFWERFAILLSVIGIAVSMYAVIEVGSLRRDLENRVNAALPWDLSLIHI